MTRLVVELDDDAAPRLADGAEREGIEPSVLAQRLLSEASEVDPFEFMDRSPPMPSAAGALTSSSIARDSARLDRRHGTVRCRCQSRRSRPRCVPANLFETKELLHLPAMVVAEATFMIERSGGSIAEAAFLRSMRLPATSSKLQPATICGGQRNSSSGTQTYASAAPTLPSSPLPTR